MTMRKLVGRIKYAILGKYIQKFLKDMQQLKYSIKHDQLIEKALNDKESGITSKKLCEHEVIVSLTTYGKRLYDVAPTIESIMQGSMKPNKIVLWLDDSMKELSLPIALKRQCERGLEISFCKDIRSYKKLIPTLYKYPDAAVITIDDDAIYHYDVVERLVNTHLQYPKDIIANRVHRMVLDKNNRPVSYMKWDWNVNPSSEENPHFLFPTGVGGTLYPPNSLHSEVMNETVFMDICKFADDVWFYSMALMNDTKIRKCYTHNLNGDDFLCNQDVQDIGLFNINTGSDCANDRQLQAVFEKYDLYQYLKV